MSSRFVNFIRSLVMTASSVLWRNWKTEFYLYIRLGLPFTLIRHENEAFWKRSSNHAEEFENASSLFSCGRQTFWKRSQFQTRWRHDNHVISLTEFSSNTNPKGPVIVNTFSNSSGVVCTENILRVFSVKPPFSNSSVVMRTERKSLQTLAGVIENPYDHC